MVPFKASPTKAMEMNKAITSSVELRGHIGHSEQLIFPLSKQQSTNQDITKSGHAMNGDYHTHDMRSQIYDVYATERGHSRSA